MQNRKILHSTPKHDGDPVFLSFTKFWLYFRWKIKKTYTAVHDVSDHAQNPDLQNTPKSPTLTTKVSHRSK
jgi:hypothetical protein